MTVKLDAAPAYWGRTCAGAETLQNWSVKPFDKFMQRTTDELRKIWPKGLVPPEVVWDAPDAEMTPELVKYRNHVRNNLQRAYERELETGRLLLELRERLDEATFWKHVKKEMKLSRKEAKAAMVTASEAKQ